MAHSGPSICEGTAYYLPLYDLVRGYYLRIAFPCSIAPLRKEMIDQVMTKGLPKGRRP